MDEMIKLYGTTWCGGTRRARRMLDDNKIAYRWIDIDQDKEAQAFVEKTNKGFRSVPTIIFPDGSILVEPDDAKLAEKLGVPKPKSFF
jgi:mycoredoxin